MNKKQAFAPIILLIIAGVLALGAGGGAYYYKKLKTTDDTRQIQQEEEARQVATTTSEIPQTIVRQAQTQPTSTFSVSSTDIKANSMADWGTYRNDKFGFEIKYPKLLNPSELLSLEVTSIDDIENPKSPTKVDVGFMRTGSKTKKSLSECFSVVAAIPSRDNSAPSVRVKNFPSVAWGQWYPLPKQAIFINGYRTFRHERVNTTPDYEFWGGCPANFHESIYDVWDTNIYLRFKDPQCNVCSNVDFNQILSTFKLIN